MLHPPHSDEFLPINSRLTPTPSICGGRNESNSAAELNEAIERMAAHRLSTDLTDDDSHHITQTTHLQPHQETIAEETTTSSPLTTDEAEDSISRSSLLTSNPLLRVHRPSSVTFQDLPPSTNTGIDQLTPLSTTSISSTNNGRHSSQSSTFTPASTSPYPLVLPAHPTTPAIGSSTEALEALHGINRRKLTPSEFHFGKELGEGSFAKVVLATLKADNTSYACKIVDKNFITKMGKVQTVMNEKRILTLLHGHIGIVKLWFTFQDQASLYYVMEFAQGGEMFDDIKKVGKYSLELARFYAAELVEILHYMHSMHIIHRDLKPENILFSDTRHLKLTDFGTAKEITEQDKENTKRRGSFVGTAEYVCPEILRDQIPTTSADMWSFGCILYQMLTGKVPFRGNTEYLTFQKILTGQIKWPNDIDPIAKDLIQKLLVIDPAQRLGATVEGYAALRAHPFFTGIQFDTLFSQPVPPRPEPTVIIPDEPDVYEYKDEDEVDDADDSGDDLPTAGGGESDEEFRLKMEQLATEEEERREKEDRVTPLPASTSPPHGLTVAEKTGASSPTSSSTSPTAAASISPIHKTSTDGQYANSVWSRFLKPGELILYTGLIIKRRALYARKRQLILTNTPRLFYVDPETMTMKKEVEWNEKLWAEVIDDSTFYIHIPKRDYYMRGLSSSSYCWVKEINKSDGRGIDINLFYSFFFL